MKNPMVFYAVIAVGVIALLAGIVMLAALHFHGKAFAVIGLGVVLLAAGIGGMVATKPKAVPAK